MTGATGNSGGEIARQLLSAGVRVRAVARSAKKLGALAAAGAETWSGDLADPMFLTAALRGADAAYVIVPQRFDVQDYVADQRRLVGSAIAALRNSGIRRVVALSTPAASLRMGPPVMLAEFEEQLCAIPEIAAVILQPMFFMENHLAAIPMIVGAGIMGGGIRGDVALPMISTRDVATAAMEHLLQPSFSGQTVRRLLGPRDYTFSEAAATLGACVGIPDLRYVQFPVQEFRHGLAAAGFSETAASAFVELAAAYNEGRIQAGVTRTPPNTTGTTLEAFARDVFAPAFRAASAGAVPVGHPERPA
ncbi:MAG TPA: NAD(P)H-binding protein [Gemmatimonadaceae bacterium]